MFDDREDDGRDAAGDGRISGSCFFGAGAAGGLTPEGRSLFEQLTRDDNIVIAFSFEAPSVALMEAVRVRAAERIATGGLSGVMTVGRLVMPSGARAILTVLPRTVIDEPDLEELAAEHGFSPGDGLAPRARGGGYVVFGASIQAEFSMLMNLIFTAGSAERN